MPTGVRVASLHELHLTKKYACNTPVKPVRRLNTDATDTRKHTYEGGWSSSL
jgi:hypothetical protein